MLNNYICALDIGSSKVAAVLAEVKRGRVNNIFFESLASKGIKKGLIVDSIELVNTISKLVKNLKTKSGINIKAAQINISGQEIATKHSRAIIPLAERGNKVVTLSDVHRVNEQARILGSSLEEEIIHMIPFSYTIDSKSNVANPVGLYSHRLEVDLFLVCAKLSSIQSLSRVINQSGFEIKDLFFSGLATSRVVFDKELSRGLNVLCDIGSDTTELVIFRDGVLKDIEILPIGGDDLTAKLSDTLKVSFELAEEIKRTHGIIGDPAEIAQDKEILVKKSNLYKPIKQKEVSEIVTSSGKLICSCIKEALEKKLPNYEVNNLVAVGRTALLEGFIETLENTLSIPVKLGRIMNSDIPPFVKENSALSGQKYLTYLVSLGMVFSVLQEKPLGALPGMLPAKNPLSWAVNRFKEVYQEYF